MLPLYIQPDDPRFSFYQRALALYEGRHSEIFDIDEFDYKLSAEDFICYDLLKMAVQIKTDLIWLEPPVYEFQNPQLQEYFDSELRKQSQLDEKMKMWTDDAQVYGDAICKIAIDQNGETSKVEDKTLVVYNVDPCIWYPDYYSYNYSKPAKSNTFLLIRTVMDNPDLEGKTAYLLEIHSPGKIQYESYLKHEVEGEFGKKEEVVDKISPMVYFADVLADVLVDQTQTKDGSFVFSTNCDYSLAWRLNGERTARSYFGMSTFTEPVISKIKALNKYANLADFLISTNSIPPLQLTPKAMNLIRQGKEEAIFEIGNGDLPDTLLKQPRVEAGRRTVYSKTLLDSMTYRYAMDKLKLFPSDREGENKFLNNPFNLDQIHGQSERLMKQLMGELNISEVFYNPSVSTGAKSGVAYKRLMTVTLNAAQKMKNRLQAELPKIVFTMLQLAKNNGLTDLEPDYPVVQFADGVVNDNMEKINEWVAMTQNKFGTVLQAIQDIQGVSEEQARKILDERNQETEQAMQQMNMINQDAANSNQDQTPKKSQKKPVQIQQSKQLQSEN